MNINLETIGKWTLIFVGLLLINIFPDNINNPYSGLILTLGIILFVHGVLIGSYKYDI